MNSQSTDAPQVPGPQSCRVSGWQETTCILRNSAAKAQRLIITISPIQQNAITTLSPARPSLGHAVSTQNMRMSSQKQALGCPRKNEKAQLSSPSADRQATPPKILAAESRGIPTFLSPPFVETHPCAIGSSICETRVSPLFNVTSLAIGLGFSQVEGVVFVGLGCRANLCHW